MEYLALRDYENVQRGSTLEFDSPELIPDLIKPFLAPMDGGFFKFVFDSFSFMNWLKEFEGEPDKPIYAIPPVTDKRPTHEREGCPYPARRKSVELVLIFLIYLGVSGFTILHLMQQTDFTAFKQYAKHFENVVIQ